MDIRKGFFDSVIDAHGVPIFPEADDLYLFMRGYINFRLLFWPCIYFTDSTINNNKALRYLMFQEKNSSSKYPFLPRDYNTLLRNGVFQIAVRNDLSMFNFSYELRNLHKLSKNSQYADIPTKKYTELIAETISHKTPIITFDIDDVSKLFTEKTKNYLKKTSEQFVPDELSKICGNLYNEYLSHDRINFMDLLGFIVKNGYDEDNNIYKKIKDEVAKCYSNNVPEVLQLNNQILFDKLVSTKNKISEELLVFNEPFIYHYAFDIEFLAYLPSQEIMGALNLTERHKFISKLNLLANGNSSNDNLCVELERYIKQLDKCFKPYYEFSQKKKIMQIKSVKDKQFLFKAYEKDASKIIQFALGEGLGATLGIVGTAFSAVLLMLDQFIVPKLDMTKDYSQKKLEEAQILALLSERSVITKK